VSVSAADTAQQLIRAGLLDEIRLSVVPCLLGAGVRLLDNIGPGPLDLEQIFIVPSDGVTHVRYRVVH
jgi:dihydrofolate reductase